MSRRRTLRPRLIEDSYEPGSVEDAWLEYCATRDRSPYPRDETYSVFRSGWRRGFGQGALMGVGTFVHTREEPE